MKNKVAFILDSTTIFPESAIGKFRYEIAPLNVTIDGNCRPETEITDEEVVSRLENCKDLKSSSPSVGDFSSRYEILFAEGYEDIIVITLSKENSGTYQCAVMAKDIVPADKKDHVYVINTLINNYGLSNVVSAFVPLLDTDITGAELAAKIQTYADNSHLMFTILDLKHLFRGGRLSKLSCAIGLLFKIKPVIEMIDGKLALTHKMRTNPDIIRLFLQTLAEYATKYKKVYVRFVYLGNNLANVETMVDAVKRTFKNVKFTIVDHVGPVFLVHLGNNGFGISMTGVDDQ